MTSNVPKPTGSTSCVTWVGMVSLLAVVVPVIVGVVFYSEGTIKNELRIVSIKIDNETRILANLIKEQESALDTISLKIAVLETKEQELEKRRTELAHQYLTVIRDASQSKGRTVTYPNQKYENPGHPQGTP